MKKKQARQLSQFQKQQTISSSDMASGILSTSSTSQQSQMQSNGASLAVSSSKQASTNTTASPLSSGSGQNMTSNQNLIGSVSLMGNINCNQLRAGDWVCLLCNNLNFSFRNECNRCMIQTKKKNLLQNLMLVQEGQQMIMSEISKQTPQNGSQQNQNGKGSTSNQIGNIETDEQLAGDNFGQIQDKKDEENVLEYSKYGSKGGSGFENMLLLLTPNRSSIHSDDYYDNRVNNTTAPQSNNSNSKSDPDQSNNNNKKKRAKNNGVIRNPTVLSNSDKCSGKMQFDEDIFNCSNKKEKPSGVMLNFSSPEDAKYISQQQQVIGNIFGNNSNTFAAFGGQKSLGLGDIRQNCDNQPLQEERREFQLFGSTKPNVDCPHFISSPSSMRDGDESLNESDSGNFQQEIQQQINNIMMDEEEEENNQQEEESGLSRRDTLNKKVEILPFFHTENEENSNAQQLPQQNQILAQSSQAGDEKLSFSFGGNYQNCLRNSNNLFSRPGQQVDINSSDKLINLQSNQNKFLQTGGLLFGGNNNSNTGFFNLHSNSNSIINNNNNANQSQKNNNNNNNNNIFFGENSNTNNQNTNNNSVGINFSNYNTFLNSNHFSQQLQSQSQQVQPKSTTPPLSIFGEITQEANGSRQHFMGSNNISNIKSDDTQFSLFSHLSTNQVKNSTLFSLDESSNTLPTNNIFNKISQYENYYKKEDLINQNTINFEQASSFINKGKSQNSNQKLTGRGTVLFSGNEDFADMSDLDDEDGDSSSESRIMKSAKKSNNIRKKRKQQGNTTDPKKKNKIQIQQYQQQTQNEQVPQQIINNNNNNNSNSFNNPNAFYNYNQSYSYQNSQHEGVEGNKQHFIQESLPSQMIFKQQQQDIIQHNNNSSQNQNSLQAGVNPNNSNNPNNITASAGSQGASNSQGQQAGVKKQDWICPRCTNLNYSFRKLCNKCQFAKNSFAIHIPPNFSAIQQQLTIF